MLKETSEIEKGFAEIAKESIEKCGNELENIRKFIHEIIPHFDASVHECYDTEGKGVSPKCINSLVFTCYLESFRISGHVLFLSLNGLYRNAFDNIRHLLESVVQALYIDFRHPKTNLPTKIEILKEVEDKVEYHAIRLIGELQIEHKDALQSEYKKLSKIIHPSHKQIVATITDIIKERGIPATVDCEELGRIYTSMVRMYDIFFFLFLNYFEELGQNLTGNADFVHDVKNYKLYMTAKALKINLNQKETFRKK
jgi:hypothetical protein